MIARYIEHGGFLDVTIVGGTGDLGADIVGSFNGKRWVLQAKFRTSVNTGKAAVIEAFTAHWSYDGDVIVAATNKKFTDDEHKDGRWQKLLTPFDTFYKNHHNEYSIQLSMYACILEEWGFEVAGAYIVYIGPGDEPASVIKCVDMREYIRKYFEKYKLNIILNDN